MIDPSVVAPSPNDGTWLPASPKVFESLHNRLTREAVDRGDPDGVARLVGIRGMLDRGEPGGLLGLAEMATPEDAQKLMRSTTIWGNLGVMTQMVDIVSRRYEVGDLLKHCLCQAAQERQWAMYRHLLTFMAEADAQTQASEVLSRMVQAAEVPLDLVAQAMAWMPQGEGEHVWRGPLLVLAAGRGRIGSVPLLLEGGHVAKEQIAEAMAEAGLYKQTAFQNLLIPYLDLDALHGEFSTRRREICEDMEGLEVVVQWRQSLDGIGRYVNVDDLAAWMERFPGEDLPATRARLREWRSGGEVETKTARPRPRA